MDKNGPHDATQVHGGPLNQTERGKNRLRQSVAGARGHFRSQYSSEAWMATSRRLLKSIEPRADESIQSLAIWLMRRRVWRNSILGRIRSTELCAKNLISWDKASEESATATPRFSTQLKGRVMHRSGASLSPEPGWFCKHLTFVLLLTRSGVRGSHAKGGRTTFSMKTRVQPLAACHSVWIQSA